jgi:hypothetical protein
MSARGESSDALSARPKSSGALQFSLFGAEAAEPVLDDLDGVLLGGGHWARLGGTARLSIVVTDMWRAVAVVSEFAARDVAAQTAGVEPANQGFVARSAFCAVLSPQAGRWTRGANQGVPPGLALTAGGLRLWAIAAGRADGAGYLMSTAAAGDAVHLIAGAQLARLGLAAVSLTHRPGPGWRITSVKRLRRLAELLGEPPEGADDDWPC